MMDTQASGWNDVLIMMKVNVEKLTPRKAAEPPEHIKCNKSNIDGPWVGTENTSEDI